MQLQKVDLKLEQEKAENTLNSFIAAQENGDIELFSECFAHSNEVTIIGTDQDEYWQGWESFYSYMQYLIGLRKDLKISTKDTKLNIDDSGNVVWYSQLIDTCIETKGDPYRIEGFRHTGVMLNKDGKWKIVQSHISVALDEDFDDFMPN